MRAHPHPVDRSYLQVVLEVFAHAGQVDGHRHLMLGEQLGWAETRDLHQMGRADGPGAERACRRAFCGWRRGRREPLVQGDD